jgi:tetratricopeptide (TPR) repeat protein
VAKDDEAAAQENSIEPESSSATNSAPANTGSTGAKNGSTPVLNIDIEDPPPMKEAKSKDRISVLREQIENAKTDAERFRLQRTLVDYLVGLGQKSEALAELRQMTREDRFDPVGFYNTGNALARLGDTDTAIDSYRKAISQRRGNYSRALNNLGVMLLRQGRWDEAYEALVNALRLESFNYAEASYNLGRAYAARGEADLAIAEWKRTLALDPDHSDAALALARAYAEDGSPERGLAVLDAFASRQSTSHELAAVRREITSGVVETRIAPAKNESVPAKTANTAVKNASARPEGSASASSSTPSVRTTTSQPAGTSLAALRTLKVDPQTYELLQRARAAREAGRLEEAATFYNRVLAERGGFFPPANLELSFVLISLHRNEEAIATLRTLTNREGARYPIAYYHLGRLYESQEQTLLAEQAFGQAARLAGHTSPQFLLDLSRLREKNGNLAGAVEAMQAYISVMEQQGQTFTWTTERLKKLRGQLSAASQPASAPEP